MNLQDPLKVACSPSKSKPRLQVAFALRPLPKIELTTVDPVQREAAKRRHAERLHKLDQDAAEAAAIEAASEAKRAMNRLYVARAYAKRAGKPLPPLPPKSR